MKESHKGWYLVYTKPRHETVAKLNLQRQAFHVYLPLLQQHKRKRHHYQMVTEPLFPRYLFIYLDTTMNDWSKIRSTRGCISLVRFAAHPARVPDALIEKLKREEINRSNEPIIGIPDFQPGDKVKILDGILANYEGIVEAKTSRERVTLLLNIAEGHTRSVNLSLHQIQIAN